MSNIAIVSIEQRQLEKKKLIWGDIIIERSGGGPQQPVEGLLSLTKLTVIIALVISLHG